VQIHPTRNAIHLAASAAITVAAGVLLESGAVVAWGGAILLGLGIARAVTEISVARIRNAGFEMLWRGRERALRVARGQTFTIEAEVRNRDARATRYAGLRPVASPALGVTIEPSEGEVPAGGRLRVTLTIEPKRTGHHALHGLSLEVRGGPGLFEVPLTFANPFGVEVLARPYARLSRIARGGRSRRDAEVGRPSPLSGESGDIRELRKHQPGDPFRRIAWKASARRGELLVREYEREERDVVFVLVDAAAELGAGHPGEAAFDHAIDEAAAVVVRHTLRGDRVGLGLIGRRVLAWKEPQRGAAHAAHLIEVLSHAPTPVHADRSGLDESDVALRVLEHMRPLDPELSAGIGPHELDRIAERVKKLLERAPFPEAEIYAKTPRERWLRTYLEAFGLGSPHRIGPDRPEVDELLIQSLFRLRAARPRPSLIYLWSPLAEPASRARLLDAVARTRSRRCELLWVNIPETAGLERGDDYAAVVARTLSRRSELAQQRAERALRELRVRVEHFGRPARP
jgi:uncharacterized protein (DUF58 family)